MASFSNNLHTAFTDNLDGDNNNGLLLDFGDGGFDNVFDVNLDDSGSSFITQSKVESDLERIFADSKMDAGAEELDRMFLEESIRSSSDVFMDTQPLEYVGMNNADGSIRHSNLRRNSHPDRIDHPVKKMKAVKFDAAPYNPKNNPKRRSSKRRRLSCNDLTDLEDQSSFIYSTTSNQARPRRRSSQDSPHAPCLAQLLGQHNGNGTENTCQYNESLQKLAASMERTELSRRQLMMQRTILLGAAGQISTAPVAQLPNQHLAQQPHQQQLANNPVQQQLHQRVMGGYTSPTPFSSNSPSPCVSPNMNDERPRILAAFFSGSRGTLTNGLEQSRRDLGMYMNRVSRRGPGFM